MNLLTSLALGTVGIPYRYGGQNPLEGFDCSGFVRYLLRSVGNLPAEDMSAQTLYSYLSKTAGALRSEPKEGAIIFFGLSEKAISHVAYCVSPKLMVEAYGDRNVVSREHAIAYRVKDGAFVRVNPIARRNDRVACLMPRYENLEVVT